MSAKMILNALEFRQKSLYLLIKIYNMGSVEDRAALAVPISIFNITIVILVLFNITIVILVPNR